MSLVTRAFVALFAFGALVALTLIALPTALIALAGGTTYGGYLVYHRVRS